MKKRYQKKQKQEDVSQKNDPPILDKSASGTETEEPEPIIATATVDTETGTPQPSQPKPSKNPFRWILTHKKISIPALVIVFVGMLAAIPITRYAIAGMLIKADYTVLIVDAQTKKPVTSATVTLGGAKANTDNKGRATIKQSVGNHNLQINKTYYKSQSETVLVPIGGLSKTRTILLTSTGRQVPITVLNKASKKPVVDAVVSAAKTEVKTDKDGKAVLVLPATKTSVEATITGKDFLKTTGTVRVTTDAVPQNTFELVPAGKMYFFSDASGDAELVETNLDGSNREVLYTVKSPQRYGNQPIFYPSKDWKYLVLYDGSDDKVQKLILIDTATKDVQTFDEGEVGISTHGWIGKYFVYTVNRQSYKEWQARAQAIKTYNAETKKLKTVDETDASGHQWNYYRESINTVHLVGDKIFYAKSIYAYPSQVVQDRPAWVHGIRPDGTGKENIKRYEVKNSFVLSGSGIYIETNQQAPDTAYFMTSTQDIYGNKLDDSLYKYSGGSATKVAGKTSQDIYKLPYRTYFASPAGDRTVWGESRDGQSVILLGDISGKETGKIKPFKDSGKYGVLGWYSNDYLLLSYHDGSNGLFLLPVSGIGSAASPMKISDYAGYGLGLQ